MVKAPAPKIRKLPRKIVHPVTTGRISRDKIRDAVNKVAEEREKEQ
jgi:hypothetical protein